MKLTIGRRIGAGFAMSIAILLFMVIYSLFNLTKLTTLQDSGAQRAGDAMHISEVDGTVPRLYQVIADAIINRELERSQQDWLEIKKEMIADLEVVEKSVDTPEEIKMAQDGKKAFQALTELFEQKMLPVLQKSEQMPTEIRQLDAELDAFMETMEVSLDGIRVSLEKEAEAADQEFDTVGESTIFVSGVISVIGVILLLSISFLTAKSIVNPIKAMTDFMLGLASGDKSKPVPAMERQDEIGVMAGAVQIFKENMIKADKLSEQQKEEERLKEIESKRVSALIQDFEMAMVTVLDSLNEADSSMRAASTQVASTSNKTKEESASVAAASEQATRNVEAVASAAEELSSSINEISRQVIQANTVSSNAVSRANDTSTQIKVLEDNVSKISEIAGLINDIADQTNLLALNATIEAARAGDAGKGFAVVASEVKNLANQTSRATEEISAQIAQVQKSTQDSVKAIEGVSNVIGEISEISTMISSSVEEQGAATQEIARNVEEAAMGTRSVSSSISDVLNAAEESNLAANSISSASDSLSSQSSTLRQKVGDFLRSVQSGGDGERAELLTWDASFETGINNIDAQHKHLIDMINNVYALVKSGERGSINDIELQKIIKHYSKHFTTEEEYMTTASYPELSSHKKAHEEFSARLIELRNAQSAERELEVLSMMASWWKKHLAAQDMPLVEFAKRQPGGVKLQA